MLPAHSAILSPHFDFIALRTFYLCQRGKAVIIFGNVCVKYRAVVFCHVKGGVAQQPLERERIPAAVHQILFCERVPLWHNKDKSESPCGATGWRFVLILFPLKSGLKMGSTGGGDKQGLHLKDKFSHANSSAIILCNSSHKLLICFGIVVHICLIPAIILPAYLRIENARTCTTSSLGIFFKVSR